MKNPMKYPHVTVMDCALGYKTILQEFYQVALRKNLYNDLATLQKDMDEWLDY